MNAIHMDLISRNEAFETLALSFIGNGGQELGHRSCRSMELGS